MTFSLEKFNIGTATRDQWNNIHFIRQELQLSDTPDEPLIKSETWEETLMGFLISPGLNFSLYLIFDATNVIGFFFFYFFDESSPTYQSKEQLVFYQINILKKFRKLGIGSSVLQFIADSCENHHKSIFSANSDVSDSKLFFSGIGAKIVQTRGVNRLNFSDIDWLLIDQWIAEGKRFNPDTTIETIVGPIPEQYISEYLKSVNETINLMPRDDAEIGDKSVTKEEIRQMEQSELKAGVIALTTLTIEKNGEVSGLTILRIYPGKEKFLTQFLTGVPLKYRGRKLGKWVKATMVKFIREQYPQSEAIISENADSNEPMLYINQKLGFKKIKENLTAQITLSELKDYFTSKEVQKFPLTK